MLTWRERGKAGDPTQDNAFGQNVASVTRWKNVTMMEGDLLYIPKGVFHAATTAEGCDTSTHATIGLL